jgi:Protein of unknown function, DUF547
VISEWDSDGTLGRRVAECLDAADPAFPIPPKRAELPKKSRSRVVKHTRSDPEIRRLDELHRDLRDKRRSPFSKKIRSHRKGLRSVKRAFFGDELIRAIADLLQESSRSRARQRAAALQEHGYVVCLAKKSGVTFIEPKADKTLFRFFCDEDPWTLNSRRVFHGNARSADVVARELQEQCVYLGDRFLSPGGQGVDYASVEGSEEFEHYLSCCTELQSVDISDLDEKMRKALFINLYNAMVIHANVTMGPPKSIFQRMNFFGKVAYCVGGSKFTLNDIEHGVLRGNVKPLGINTKVPFRKGDPRLANVLTLDPRVHFVLVCGAKGCPPIKIVSPDILDQALDWATEGFCEAECQVEEGKNGKSKVTLSMLFKWYGSDFGPNTLGILNFIAEHVPKDHEIHDVLAECNRTGKAPKVKFNTYDWSLNNDTPEEREDLHFDDDSSQTSELSVTTEMSMSSPSRSASTHSLGSQRSTSTLSLGSAAGLEDSNSGSPASSSPNTLRRRKSSKKMASGSSDSPVKKDRSRSRSHSDVRSRQDRAEKPSESGDSNRSHSERKARKPRESGVGVGVGVGRKSSPRKRRDDSVLTLREELPEKREKSKNADSESRFAAELDDLDALVGGMGVGDKSPRGKKRGKPAASWAAELEKRGIPASRAAELAETLADEQIALAQLPQLGAEEYAELGFTDGEQTKMGFSTTIKILPNGTRIECTEDECILLD